jgi:tRNA (cmo5U34)-methyltransferase
MNDIVIRENIEQFMVELRNWLNSTNTNKLEEMGSFFADRVGTYEKHMSVWSEAYEYMAQLVPKNVKTILDIGCGTGLELDEIFKLLPEIKVVGIDLSQAMLQQLKLKHHDKNLELLCADYFKADINAEYFDAVVSFQTLHHFRPQMKLDLFKKLYRALKSDGRYIETDYIACCEEEEELLFSACKTKRESEKIPDDVFVHFDTPLTVEHEISLLKTAGFATVNLVSCINGASIIVCCK